jgi:hypothetical protein
MTLEQAYYIAEIMGVVTIIAALIFVGLQLRQNAEQTRISNNQAALNNWNELSFAYANHPEMIEFYNQHTHPDLKEHRVSSPELQRHMYYLTAAMQSINNTHRQWREGNLPDDTWRAFRAGLLDMFTDNHLTHEYWQNVGEMPYFDDDFRQLIGEVIAEAHVARIEKVKRFKARAGFREKGA